MQNKYLEMMEATQQAIERAGEISRTAETVTNMLGIHKDDLSRMAEVIAGRFQAIREMLGKDEKEFLAQIGTMRSELDAAIANMQGAEPSTSEAHEPSAGLVTAEQTYVGGGNAEAE